MKLYKLTDQGGYTRYHHPNQCLWGPGVSHSGTGEGGLCGPGYIHAYTDPLLAVLLNPIHANFTEPRLWECEGVIAKRDYDLKVGCVTLTTVREIELPVVTTEQRVRFALLCALAVYDDAAFAQWAKGWLSGADRSAEAAVAALAAAAEAGAAGAAAWAAAAKTLDLAAIAREAVGYRDAQK